MVETARPAARNLRIPIAAVAGLVFFAAWIAGAAMIGEHLVGQAQAVQLVYYAAAGLLWVLPIRWLMLWAAHLR